MAAAANLINMGWPGDQRAAWDRLRQDIPTGPASPSHRARPPPGAAKNRPVVRDSDGLSSGRAGAEEVLYRFRR